MAALIENHYQIDRNNNRIVCHLAEANQKSMEYISQLEADIEPGKTIIYARKEHGGILQSYGYEQEGMISGFFQGEDSYIFSKFHQEARRITILADKVRDSMVIVERDDKNVTEADLAEGFEVVPAGKEDADEISALYKKVFEQYPTDVRQPEYLREKMGDDYFFVTVKHHGRIVSVASALIRTEFNCAEITDCATEPDYRGKSLLYPIVMKLEEMLIAKGIHSFYSMTRALSPGMNLTVKRLGYTFQGRLVNNCNIATGYEDMNIWTKVSK